MKPDEERLGVALTKEACPLCGSIHDGDIVMNTRLTPGEARKVKELHGQVIGFMKQPCDTCKDLMSKGFLFIGIVEEKSGKTRAEIYRSGNQWVTTHEFAKRLELEESVLAGGYTFIDVKAADKLGFPDVNLTA